MSFYLNLIKENGTDTVTRLFEFHIYNETQHIFIYMLFVVCQKIYIYIMTIELLFLRL